MTAYKSLLIRYVILMPFHLAVKRLCSFLLTGKIIYINLNSAEIEISSGTNKRSGNKKEKKRIEMYKSVSYSSVSVHQAPSTS